jgi:pyruvate dehydrogenase E1 component alpha subunit
LTTPHDGAEKLQETATAPSIVPPEALSSATVLEHGSAPSLTPEQELEAYRQMLLIRRFEEKAGQLYGMGLIGGFCHLYIGQEAVVTGIQMAREEGDQVITAYRDHGHMLACGMDPKGVMAELTGRRHGYSKGKGGSMHMFSVAKNFYGVMASSVPARGRACSRQQISRQRPHLPHLLRRGRRQSGPGL